MFLPPGSHFASDSICSTTYDPRHSFCSLVGTLVLFAFCETSLDRQVEEGHRKTFYDKIFPDIGVPSPTGYGPFGLPLVGSLTPLIRIRPWTR